MYSLGQVIQIINRSGLKLDTSGVTGLLGGNNAIDALETIHLYAGRRWAGWYNYPGVVTVAQRFGQIANSRFWDSVFPGPNKPPAVTFNLAGTFGSNYSGSYSATQLRTKYLGYLIAEQCADCPSREIPLTNRNGGPGRKTGNPATVTIVSLPSAINGRKEFIPIKPKRKPPLAFLAIIPSVVSILACVLCVLGQDPLCASLILLGIISSGISSLLLGSAELKLHVPVPSESSPPGDGLILPEGGSVIVLKGEEADVNIITKGQFELTYPSGISLRRKDPTGKSPCREYRLIGISCLLLVAQFLAQLLLIPRCTVFGQILFLVSFVASGVYHLYVASFHRESVHWDLLSEVLPVTVEKRTLGTRTQMAVFVCLVLGHGRPDPLASKPDTVLTCILPNVNETPMWRYWKGKVLKEVGFYWRRGPNPLPYTPTIQAEPEDDKETKEYLGLTELDKALLNDLIGDAWCIFNRYPTWRDGDPQVMPEAKRSRRRKTTLGN